MRGVNALDAEWEEVSSWGWSIRNSLRYPTSCHGLFGLLLPLLLFIEPKPLRFVGERDCEVPPPPPSLVFLPREGSHVSSHYRLCVWGERAALWLRSHLQASESASRLPPTAVGRCWLESLLSGALPPTLFVCLPVYVSLPASLSVFPRHLAAAALEGLTVPVLLQDFQMTSIWRLETNSHILYH